MSETSPPAPQGDPLDQFLCFSVYATGLAFNRVYKPLLDRFGITYPQYLALVALRGADAQTVSALGAKLHLESNTLTPLIKRLESAGLVTRTRDKQDERVVRVALSDAGRSLIDDALGCIPAALLEATGMRAEELTALNHKLASLGAALRSAAAPAGRAG
ncbi:MarR family transcriptional regulator [Sphingomonas spermidinifaciens]|uniref:MarR family transcriptional regulator n=1 Tax=Sphingomonas spermidinifaciens TaxID=1141889 RepID=A0A2A4B4S5_9SPHN|nr:MarR family transcriptional regulator [Sphingomonas spermidinifaciens]PCD02952.1 MarR family transcriptional regulator [Sphingomonas spermidinifaciens]